MIFNISRPIMGTREIIAELDEVQPNGKMFKKYQLGDYRWISYEDLDSTSDYFGRGTSVDFSRFQVD